MFNHIAEPDYAHDEQFLEQFQPIKQTSKYTILGTGCAPIKPNTAPYLNKLAASMEKIHGYRTEARPCHILFRNKILINSCEWINGQQREADGILLA